MNNALPTVTRTYHSWCIDSRRWDRLAFRDDDVVVVTPYKSGTTWMLNIVGHLFFNDLKQRDPKSFGRWIDAPFRPIDEDLAELEGMPHRRALKSHLALDGLPYDPRVRYIYVGRDLRDIFMSLWNHHTNYTPELIKAMNDAAARSGLPPMPEVPADIRAFWREWITRGWFDWESDGYPYWSSLNHLNSWWQFRHLPNVLFVHYNDLLANLPAEIARVGDFIGIRLGAERFAEIADLTTFSAMKRDAEIINPGAHFGFRGGPSTFINKGTNGRWRDVLTEADIDLYRAAMRHLPDDAASWMEAGKVAARQPEWSI